MRLPCIALLLWAGTAVAQTGAAVDSTGPICWRGRPLPHCASFVITDFGYGKRLNPVPEFGAEYVTFEIGGMVNQGPRTAWGASAVKSIGADRSYVAMRPRYRRWLNDETSLDLALGIVVSGDHERFTPRYPGFTAHATLSRGDILGLTLGAEVIRGGPAGADVGWYGGARFGSYAAPVAGGLFLLMLALALAGQGQGT